jgi:Sigma-70, region 4
MRREANDEEVGGGRDRPPAERGSTVRRLRVATVRNHSRLYLLFPRRTQSEIGERIGVSQTHVSRLIRRSLAPLEKAAEREPGGWGVAVRHFP